MSYSPEATALAALTICESLLLALTDLNLIAEAEVVGIVQDAITTLEASDGPDIRNQQDAAALLRQILLHGNSVRRRP